MGTRHLLYAVALCALARALAQPRFGRDRPGDDVVLLLQIWPDKEHWPEALHGGRRDGPDADKDYVVIDLAPAPGVVNASAKAEGASSGTPESQAAGANATEAAVAGAAGGASVKATSQKVVDTSVPDFVVAELAPVLGGSTNASTNGSAEPEAAGANATEAAVAGAAGGASVKATSQKVLDTSVPDFVVAELAPVLGGSTNAITNGSAEPEEPPGQQSPDGRIVDAASIHSPSPPDQLATRQDQLPARAAQKHSPVVWLPPQNRSTVDTAVQFTQCGE
ncbi:unnamed protein product, partial [Prorocentrum cordatum]